MSELEVLVPDWPAPAHIRAACSTRAGGVSAGGYASLNLAEHVEDDVARVRENRLRLRKALRLPAEPLWLKQVHGVAVARAGQDDFSTPPEADAAVSTRDNQVCAILTADCLPVLFCDREGSCVGAAHAGWRGLAAGVLTATIRALDRPADELLAWLGPAIGPESFEVGPEVRARFVARHVAAGDCFRPSHADRWLADLYGLARIELAAAGVTAVYGGGWCTLRDAERFFSFRREARCGRMVTLIWRAPR